MEMMHTPTSEQNTAGVAIVRAESDWETEAFSLGVYSRLAMPKFITGYGRALRESSGRVHRAGTEKVTEWSGYMEGPVESGGRVAREIPSDKTIANDNCAV